MNLADSLIFGVLEHTMGAEVAVWLDAWQDTQPIQNPEAVGSQDDTRWDFGRIKWSRLVYPDGNVTLSKRERECAALEREVISVMHQLPIPGVGLTPSPAPIITTSWR